MQQGTGGGSCIKGNNPLRYAIRRRSKRCPNFFKQNASVQKDGKKGLLYLHKWQTGQQYLIFSTNKAVDVFIHKNLNNEKKQSHENK